MICSYLEFMNYMLNTHVEYFVLDGNQEKRKCDNVWKKRKDEAGNSGHRCNQSVVWCRRKARFYDFILELNISLYPLNCSTTHINTFKICWRLFNLHNLCKIEIEFGKVSIILQKWNIFSCKSTSLLTMQA